MTIKRIIEGKEYTIDLTDGELDAAFREQERKYFLSDIGNALDWLNDGDENEKIDEDRLLNDFELCNAIIKDYEFATYNEYDVERWSDAIRDNLPSDYYIPLKVDNQNTNDII